MRSPAVKTTRLLPLVAAVLFALSCSGQPESRGEARAVEPDTEPERDVITVRVAPLTREPMSEIYSTSATLRADRHATVIARTQGVIRNLTVEEGDRVEQGQTLAVLEDDEQGIELERARSSFEIERQEFERAERLHDDELLSREAFQAARRELEEARHTFARAELELGRTRIPAPFTGRILVRHLDTGATVSDGTPVYDLADLDPLYADVAIPERHVARLAPAQRVRLVADAGGEEAWAIIERIAPSVDPSTGTVKVTLAVRNGRGLRPGAFVRARIVTQTRPSALVAPRSALVAEGRRWHLFRLEADGETVKQLEVHLGFEEGDRVEIGDLVTVDEVLRPGDPVVTLGAPALSDGSRVRVIDEDDRDGTDAVRTRDEPA